jgi:signal transduction histidine kinase
MMEFVKIVSDAMFFTAGLSPLVVGHGTAWLAVLGAAWAFLVVAVVVAAVRRRWILTRILASLEAIERGWPRPKMRLVVGGRLGHLARLVDSLNMLGEDQKRRLVFESCCFQAILNKLEHPVIIVDEADRAVLANHRAMDLFASAGATEEESFHWLVSQPQVAALIAAARRGDPPARRQIRLNGMARPRTVQMTVAPVRGGNEIHGTLLLLEDQTELIQNLQIKADFAANASHELRTPLASIRAAVETITEAGVEDRQTLLRCLNIIGGHVLRLQLLVQDLLDLSRTEDPRAVVRLEPIHLAEVREVVRSLFSATALEKHLDLRFHVGPGADVIVADERLVMLILKNLVDNSLKFTSTGFVEIRWFRRHRTAATRREIAISGQAENSNTSVGGADPSACAAEAEVYVLEVEDSGCGIPAEDANRVFERFYTVNRSRGGADRGTGLGLAIVKHAVGALGGVVELASRPGAGTTMRCIWPAPPESSTSAGENPVRSKPHS